MFKSDIDIDVPPNFDKSIFPWARASIVKDEKLIPHPSGIYPQNISIDPVTGLSAIPYEQAEELGYVKLDLLNLNVYSKFKSRQEVLDFASKEPDWSLLQLPSNHEKLFQLSNHGELLLKLKPSSIIELADVLALIRPGKKQLLGLYQNNKHDARKMLYDTSKKGFSFKKSHAISYALVIVLQLHLIEQNRL